MPTSSFEKLDMQPRCELMLRRFETLPAWLEEQIARDTFVDTARTTYQKRLQKHVRARNLIKHTPEPGFTWYRLGPNGVNYLHSQGVEVRALKFSSDRGGKAGRLPRYLAETSFATQTAGQFRALQRQKQIVHSYPWLFHTAKTRVYHVTTSNQVQQVNIDTGAEERTLINACRNDMRKRIEEFASTADQFVENLKAGRFAWLICTAFETKANAIFEEARRQGFPHKNIPPERCLVIEVLPELSKILTGRYVKK